MKLITQTDIGVTRFGDEKTVRAICEAGFDAIDYSMFKMREDDYVLNTSEYKKHIAMVKAVAEEYGKGFSQAHAPFPSYKVGDEDYNKTVFERISRSIEIAGFLGVEIIVVHPTDFLKPSEENIKLNAEFYNRLAPLCEEYGLKIAVENMWGYDKRRGYIVPNICSLPDEFNRMMALLDPKYFTACIDIGHCGLVGIEPQDMLREVESKYIGCLHVHDNDYKKDKHLPPYFGDTDWEAVTQSLADIGYQGNFTFEADMFLRPYPEELIPTAFRYLHDIGRYLIKRIEEKKA